jgi:hypothetical protein
MSTITRKELMRGSYLITIAQNATIQLNIQTLPYMPSFANTFDIILIIWRAFDIKKKHPICFASNLKIYDHFKNEAVRLEKDSLQTIEIVSKADKITSNSISKIKKIKQKNLQISNEM